MKVERRGGRSLWLHVPMVVVFGVLAQGASIVWWASAKEREGYYLTQRVEHLEDGFTKTSSRQEEALQQLARIEERLGAQMKVLERIEGRVR